MKPKNQCIQQWLGLSGTDAKHNGLIKQEQNRRKGTLPLWKVVIGIKIQPQSACALVSKQLFCSITLSLYLCATNRYQRHNKSFVYFFSSGRSMYVYTIKWKIGWETLGKLEKGRMSGECYTCKLRCDSRHVRRRFSVRQAGSIN